MTEWVAAVPDAAEKRLDEMDRLGDMTHFPAAVNAGATANVLVTMCVTWWLAVRFLGPLVPFVWILLVLCANLLPVVLLRLTMASTAPMPTLRSMDFFRDQHKFSDWVYLAASANMAFWVLLTWSASLARHGGWVLAALLVAAFAVTFSPILLRGKRG